MENKITEWLGISGSRVRSGKVLMERSIRLPRVLMIAAGRRSDDTASTQADLAYRRLRADGWPVGRCKLGEGAKTGGPGHVQSGGSRMSCLKQLVRLLPRWDVVHIFVSSLTELVSFSLPAVLLGRFFGRKIVVHIYSVRLGEWLEQWGRVIVPVLRQADVVAVSSGGSLRALKERRLKAMELPALVDSRMFHSRDIETLQPRIIVTRALEHHANPTLVLRAFRIVKQKYPRAELVMAGDGTLRGELDYLMASERITGVTFPGAIPHQEMARYYDEADLYINGSFRADVPISLFEARACGLPVISLGQHEKHLKCEIENHIDLADLIILLVESPDMVKRLLSVSRAEKSALEWSECRGRWTRLYLDLAGRSGR